MFDKKPSPEQSSLVLGPLDFCWGNHYVIRECVMGLLRPDCVDMPLRMNIGYDGYIQFIIDVNNSIEKLSKIKRELNNKSFLPILESDKGNIIFSKLKLKLDEIIEYSTNMCKLLLEVSKYYKDKPALITNDERPLYFLMNGSETTQHYKLIPFEYTAIDDEYIKEITLTLKQHLKVYEGLEEEVEVIIKKIMDIYGLSDPAYLKIIRERCSLE
ncbi:MAG: hypothetical protein PHF74_08015 [Dehalococcoidales bacterium]|nr:hypothetical protein [Dehalococcoidales bacterium]